MTLVCQLEFVVLHITDTKVLYISQRGTLECEINTHPDPAKYMFTLVMSKLTCWALYFLVVCVTTRKDAILEEYSRLV